MTADQIRLIERLIEQITVARIKIVKERIIATVANLEL
jgi:hypothetical protein